MRVFRVVAAVRELGVRRFQMSHDLFSQVEAAITIAGVVAVARTVFAVDVVRHAVERFHFVEAVLTYPLADYAERIDSFQAHTAIFRRVRFAVFTFSCHRFCSVIEFAPNQSPEPTAVGAVSSAIAVHVASRRWLSFLR